jgi:mannan endo-1,4-beta-mannosidase
MDCYHGTKENAFTSNLEALSAVSKDKKKPCGDTEDGK